MANEDDTFTVDINKFDLKVVFDMMMTLGITVDDPDISDEEFRKTMREKVDAISFLVQAGVMGGGELANSDIMKIVLEHDD